MLIEQQQLLEKSYRHNSTLIQQKVLIVDDDIRNIFALSSVLERYNMQVFFAENGRACIEMLQKNPDIKIILMDIMMPEMNGYETIGQIVNWNNFRICPLLH